MKEFDIEKAKAGAKVITRSGLAVTISDFAYKYPGPDLKPQELIMGTIEGGDVELWDKQGHINTDGRPDKLDLVLG